MALKSFIIIVMKRFDPTELAQGFGVAASADRPGLAEEVGEVGPGRRSAPVGGLLEEVDQSIADEFDPILANNRR